MAEYVETRPDLPSSAHGEIPLRGELWPFEEGWSWEIPIPDTTTSVRGWAFTRWGARRALRKAAVSIRKRRPCKEVVWL